MNLGRNLLRSGIPLLLLLTTLAHGAERVVSPLESKKSVARPSETVEATFGHSVTPEIEVNIVDFFTQNRCDKVLSAIPRALYRHVTPLIAAVIAYCIPDE